MCPFNTTLECHNFATNEMPQMIDDALCEAFKQKGYCYDEDKGFMKEKCKKTCGFCNSGTNM